jgi:hypothetical protein
VLFSDALVLIVVASAERIEAVSPWFPARSRVHQGLEAAHRLAEGRHHGVIVFSDEPLADATDAAVRDSLAGGTPHLDEISRIELADSYLGRVGFDRLG